MRTRVIFSKFVFGLGLAALAFVAASELRASPLPFDEYAGLQFSAPGPNCFASAAKMTGVSSHFRGMDEPEFRLIVENFCKPVTKPEVGDIGVFSVPGFGLIHAFVFVNENLGIQKPGVDYLGPTPINYASMSSIDYSLGASPECRRYSPDPSQCSNHKSYVRCTPVDFSSVPDIRNLNGSLLSIEDLQDEVLLADKNLDHTLLSRLEKDLYLVRSKFEALPESLRNSKLGKIFAAKLVSLHKQNEFFRQRLPTENLIF